MAAAALTWLQIINRVLVRMRESTVAANNSTEYSTLIGGLVNQVKTEIEEAYYWSALRQTFTVSTTGGSGVSNYTLTSAGPNAAIIDAWNTTTGQQLTRGTNADFNAMFFGAAGSVLTGPAEQFLSAGLSVNYDMTVDIWPLPSASETLKFNVYKPQVDLAIDSDVPLVPQNVLIEEVIARAKVERGEEDAPQPQPGMTFIRSDLLASAISREGGQDDSEMDWEAV